MERDYKDVSMALKALRQRKGLSQTDVALMLGKKSKQTVSAWERHPEKLSIENLCRIVELYGVDPIEFIRAIGAIFFNPKFELDENTKQ